jgi:HD-GYP domain-containing protein (c-di-GMP phosphodiesterase class II)
MSKRRINYKYILELDSELNQIQDFDLLLERILFEARKVLHADAGSIYVCELVEKDGQEVEELVIKYAQNDTTAKLLPPGQKPAYSFFTVPINEKTISGYCAYSRTLVNVPDAYNLPPGVPFSFNTSYDQRSGYKTTSSLAVPLNTAEGKLLGVIQVFNAKDKGGNVIPFSQDDEFLMTYFAANATRALQRASLTRFMILRMIRMAELRDPKETGTHVNRVAGYAIEIYDRWAHHQGIPETERERFRDTLKIAAMLHDVGKVAISDIILKKPAKFTEEEFLVMQHHTIYGASLFDDSQSALDNISRDIALCHHENWDGTGYPGWVDTTTGEATKAGPEGKPLGLKGEEIPLTGRIVALADVYDAICSKRVYKQAKSENEVLTEIRKKKKKKFDPVLTDIFFEVLPNIKQIQNRFPE